MIKKTEPITYTSPELEEFLEVYDAIICTSEGSNDSYENDDDYILN